MEELVTESFKNSVLHIQRSIKWNKTSFFLSSHRFSLVTTQDRMQRFETNYCNYVVATIPTMT